MYASSLAEHNEATFVVFKVIEFAVITNYKHIAIATTCYHNTSLAGLQGIIVCPSTPYMRFYRGLQPFKVMSFDLDDTLYDNFI